MAARLSVPLVLTTLPLTGALAADQVIQLSARVPSGCRLSGAPAFSSLVNFVPLSVGQTASVLNIAVPVGETGLQNAAGFTFSIGLACNLPSQFTMTSLNGGLRDPEAEAYASSGDVARIDYVALASWSSESLGALATSGIPNVSASSPPSGVIRAGALQVTVGMLPERSRPMLAGFYSDTLRIMLFPQ